MKSNEGTSVETSNPSQRRASPITAPTVARSSKDGPLNKPRIAHSKSPNEKATSSNNAQSTESFSISVELNKKHHRNMPIIRHIAQVCELIKCRSLKNYYAITK